MYSNYAESENSRNPFFVGTVVDNNDPTNNYRVRVRLPKIHDNIQDSDLPWAARVDRTFRGIVSETPNLSGPESKAENGTGNKGKTTETSSKKKNSPKFDHCLPEVGTKVLVLAIRNDMNALLYLGSLYMKTEFTPTEEKKYLKTYGVYGEDNQFIGVDETNDENNKLKVHFVGHVDIDKVKKIDVKAEDDVKLSTKKSIEESAEDTITLKANKNIVIKIQQTESSNQNEIVISISKDGNINIKSEKITLEGEVNIKGNMNVTGNIKSSKEVSAKSGSVNLSTHTHLYSPGPGTPTPTNPGIG